MNALSELIVDLSQLTKLIGEILNEVFSACEFGGHQPDDMCLRGNDALRGIFDFTIKQFDVAQDRTSTELIKFKDMFAVDHARGKITAKRSVEVAAV